MAECIAETNDSHWDQNGHIVALFAVVGASAVGVFLPIVGQTIRGLNQMSMPMFAIQLGQFFGAGVIIATAFLHLLPAANDSLSNSCLGDFAERYGAWACVIALAAVFSMHSVEWWLVEAWMGRSNSGPYEHHDAQESGNNDGLFPPYAESRMVLPPPVLSPPVNPRVFGAPSLSVASIYANGRAGFARMRDINSTGFALTRHGNYAALARSRQQLALVQSDRMSRCLYSDPQFPLYAPSTVWPMPPMGIPAGMSPALAIHGAAQAKSTPELMRRLPRANRASHGSSTMSSSAHNTHSSHAVSLRPDSFSHAAKKRRRARDEAVAAAWRQRCLSMPRLPPTTLDAGLCESLLEPLPGSHAKQAKRASASPQSQRSRHSRPISAVLAAKKRESKRRSLQAVAALGSAAKRSSMGPVGATSPESSAQLDPVPEMDDSLATSQQHRESDDVSAAQVFASATSAMPRPSEAVSRQQTFHSTHTHKRVSIPTPHVIRAAPSSCAFRSVSAEQRQQLSADYVKPAHAADEEESTAIQSRPQSSVSDLSIPIDVKQRALATYVLELGIALYSVLIGLALAISDSGFVALFVAICFHQFFEGLALGASLAELYWIKAQLIAHRNRDSRQIQTPDEETEPLSESPRHETIVSVRSEAHHAIDIGRPITTPDARSAAASDGFCSEDFEYVSPGQPYRHSKARRTMTSMATSFAPEPWLVNPQLEKTIAGGPHSLGHRGASTTQPPDVAAAAAEAQAKAKLADARPQRPRYLVPRNTPERLPGWWKAWLSALAFCATTPTGIIIGLALHNVYEPHSRYALLFNGVLQSICTGVLVYTGLVTLMIGGFNSPQVKQLPRLMQVLLFVAVYAGAAVMGGLKFWK
ncbi:hypothetical protein GGF43_003131 [Coemansia sp. RSA 2618]|nr:hypothetical protein GGF43_003131 [Coemansia sp. RSA 2618]